MNNLTMSEMHVTTGGAFADVQPAPRPSAAELAALAAFAAEQQQAWLRFLQRAFE